MKTIQKSELRSKVVLALQEQKEINNKLPRTVQSLYLKAIELSEEYKTCKKEYVPDRNLLSSLFGASLLTNKVKLLKMIIGSTAIWEGVKYLEEDVNKVYQDDYAKMDSKTKELCNALKLYIQSLEKLSRYLSWIISRLFDAKSRKQGIPIWENWIMQIKLGVLTKSFQQKDRKLFISCQRLGEDVSD